MLLQASLVYISSNLIILIINIAADANIIINHCRIAAQRYLYTYQESMPVEQLVKSICDTKQAYTQFGGQRPFGVSLIFGGWYFNLILIKFKIQKGMLYMDINYMSVIPVVIILDGKRQPLVQIIKHRQIY